MIEYSNEEMVEAIEDGRIVKVSEYYAKREGLLVLRRPPKIQQESSSTKEKKDEQARKNKGFIGMEDLRRPLRSQQNDLMNELVENFHWLLVQKRKARLLTRKKLADSIGESETNIKMIESGVLPMNNFILVNKLESFYGVSLRKNKPASPEGRQLRPVIDYRKRIEERRGQKGMEQSGIKSAEEVIDVSQSPKKEGKEEIGEIDIVDLEKY